MIKPTLVQWNDDMAGVQIVKFNCNSKNKDLGKSLGIKVAPTFFLYKNGDQVATMTGAKVDDLLKLIEQHK
jgi:thioredoxin 1